MIVKTVLQSNDVKTQDNLKAGKELKVIKVLLVSIPTVGWWVTPALDKHPDWFQYF